MKKVSGRLQRWSRRWTVLKAYTVQCGPIQKIVALVFRAKVTNYAVR
jgi:hypothetical protein